MFHQHFNISPQAARYLAVQIGSVAKAGIEPRMDACMAEQISATLTRLGQTPPAIIDEVRKGVQE
jgi:hypothetical protein